jgi:hypothetical protein
VTLRVRLHLREGVLYLGAVLMAGSLVFMARGPVVVSVPFLPMRAVGLVAGGPVIVALPFGASARVDVGEVERVGLRQPPSSR